MPSIFAMPRTRSDRVHQRPRRKNRCGGEHARGRRWRPDRGAARPAAGRQSFSAIRTTRLEQARGAFCGDVRLHAQHARLREEDHRDGGKSRTHRLQSASDSVSSPNRSSLRHRSCSALFVAVVAPSWRGSATARGPAAREVGRGRTCQQPSAAGVARAGAVVPPCRIRRSTPPSVTNRRVAISV
jgi:hypothetical protein